MSLEGKGFYIWQIPRCENGDVVKIANLAQQANLSHLLIKIADGGGVYQKNASLLKPLVSALRARGIEAWGWQYVYGRAPVAEASVAIRLVDFLNLDGFIVNAEHQYKEPDRRRSAGIYMRYLRKGLPNTVIGLSSYRFPSYHPQLPWRDFLNGCDINMPQVYWVGSSNPAIQLRRTLREFNSMTPLRPILPTGAAFYEHNWIPKENEIVEFMQAAQESNLPALNFWEWSAARTHGLWDVVARYDWSSKKPGDKDIAVRFVEALNTNRAEEVADLYALTSVHITGFRAIQGVNRIKEWYGNLFENVLPDAKFTLTGYTSAGKGRHFTWIATSSKGSVLNGKDTVGLIDGKIGYHYSFYKVT